jgi:Asp-tRNA(Asn)/Glu-tRNA(Gln) amidotransferase B subunit
VRRGKIEAEELMGGGGTGASGAAKPLASRLTPLVRALEADEIRLEATEQILDHLVTDRTSNPDEIMDRYRMMDSDLDDLAMALRTIVGSAGSELRVATFDVALRWGVGRLMRQLLGRLDPVLVRARLEEALQAAGWESPSQEVGS